VHLLYADISLFIAPAL